MTASESIEGKRGEVPEGRWRPVAAQAGVVLGLATLVAAFAARVVAPDALYDRYLLLAAIGAGVSAATLGRRRTGMVSRSATIGALSLLAIYAVAVVVVPPPHDGVKSVVAKAQIFDEKLAYVEGGNGIATLWPEESEWRMSSSPDPSTFEASRGNVRLRIARIDASKDEIELGDYADFALSDLVDRGEIVACDWEGPGDYGDRPTAWRSILTFDDEADETPTYGVFIVFAEGDSVYGARFDAPDLGDIYEAGPAVRKVMSGATADPAKKVELRKRVGWVPPSVASSSASEAFGGPTYDSSGTAGPVRVPAKARPFKTRGGRAGALKNLSEALGRAFPSYNEAARGATR